MFYFLEPEKERKLWNYPFAQDFLKDMISFDTFLDDIRNFQKELGFNEEDIELIRQHDDYIKKIQNSKLIYNKREDLKVAIKRNFVLANIFKDRLPVRKPGLKPGNDYVTIPRDEMIRLYRQCYIEVSKMSEKDLDGHIIEPNYIDRWRRFGDANWDVETIDIKDMGVWPRYDSSDHFITYRNVPDTAKKIKDFILGNTHDWPSIETQPPVPEKAINKAYSIRRYADIIYRLFPIIITERGKDTRRIRINAKGMTGGYRYEVTPYDVDDGSNRIVAFALMGIKKIKCFVGRGLDYDSAPEGTK